MRQFSRERLRNRNGGAQARSSKDEDDGFRGKAQDEQQGHHQRLAHSGAKRAAVLTESAKTGSMPKSPAAA